MTDKNYNREDLKKYKYNQKYIKRQLEDYEEKLETVQKLTASYSDMPKAQNKPNYTIENLMDKYNEIIEILNKDQERQNEIIFHIRRLEEPFKTILTDRYIYDMSLEETSVDIGYAYENTCRLHGKALNMFDELDKSTFEELLKNVKN